MNNINYLTLQTQKESIHELILPVENESIVPKDLGKLYHKNPNEYMNKAIILFYSSSHVFMSPSN